MDKKINWSRRTFLKGSVWAGGAGIAAPLLTSCAGPSSSSAAGAGDLTLDALKQKGFVSVGIWGSAVYGFTDKNGRVTGEAPEVARAVFKRLGVNELRATQVGFDQMIPALNARQFDMVCAGMIITSARCQNALFSRPDYVVNEALLVPKGNPLNVKTYEDIAKKNLKVAIGAGASERAWLLASGIQASQILGLEGNQQILDAVVSGRAYASSLTDMTTKSLLQQNPNAPVEIANIFQPTVNGQPKFQAGGFVFRQGNQQILDAFNQGLAAIQDSGEWVKIVEPFGFTKDNLPPKDLTTQQLCAAN